MINIDIQYVTLLLSVVIAVYKNNHQNINPFTPNKYIFLIILLKSCII